MKLILYFSLIIFGFTTAVVAQPTQRDDRIEALRVAFLTRQLQLTPEEAKAFWPVYDSYQAESQKLLDEHKQKKGDEIELEEKMLALRKKYKPDFVKATSEEKFNKLLKAEREFRDVLRKEIERRRGKQGQ